MSNLTPEQQLAVDKKNTSIIVSAGAGSGKTTVLKSRVLRELKEGVNVNQLIILTFTNNAAQEMKERIRDVIASNPDVKDQEILLDSAYITTFDSFAQSIVKKYSYLLNISKHFSIIEDNILKLKLKEFLNNIFEEYYKKEDKRFLKLIKDFSIKNDDEIRNSIIIYYYNIQNLCDKESFLKNYIEEHFSKTYINNVFKSLRDIIDNKIETLIVLLEELEDETIKEKAIEQNRILKGNITMAKSLDEIREALNLKIANANKGWYTDEAKEIKNKAKKIMDEILELIPEDEETMRNHLLSTKDYAEVIIEILTKLDNQISEYKRETNCYTFQDIAILAIKLVREHDDIKEIIKKNTYEIMIDEYQDTNDIQETFIAYIQNNNVYMVGDIKQSIYRFRNANPYIFKNKYDLFKDETKGFKIDLNANFRSRNEVVESINTIFNAIMYSTIGGASYKQEHQMVYGNKEYDNHITNTKYGMEILSYTNEKNIFSNPEIEAFIMAKDIIKRIKNKEQVVRIENKKMVLRDIDYKDFCILADKSTNFTLFKKILEYNNIPTTIYKDISINEENEIFILKNLITLLIKIKDNVFDEKFKHAFISISRSYICNINDQEIYNMVENKSYKDTTLYNKLLGLVDKIDTLSNREILIMLIEEFDIINKLITVGNVQDRLTKLEYIVNNSTNLNNLGLDINGLDGYFDEILKNENEIKMATNKDSSSNTVKIMTIHGSKGLEYPVIYLASLEKDFFKSGKKDTKESAFKYSNDYGLILPFYDNGIGKTILNIINNHQERIEIISEKIRLLYVALTRAKEHVILLSPYDDKTEPIKDIQESDLLNVNSFNKLLSLIRYNINKYITNINIDDLNITRDYNITNNKNYTIDKSNIKINVEELNLENKYLDNKHFSKPLSKLIDEEFKERLDYGTFMHYIFEITEFNIDKINNMDIDNKYKDIVLKFLKHDEVKNIKDAKIYKEHEILFKKDNIKYHGFIDLMLEYDNHIDIIDYKLSNIESEEYKIQLNGYKDYIENKYNKEVNIYLYSIKKDIFKKI